MALVVAAVCLGLPPPALCGRQSAAPATLLRPGFPLRAGRELAVKETLQAEGPGGAPTELVIRVRTFLAGGRVYLLTAVGESNDPASRAATKFFMSFELTK